MKTPIILRVALLFTLIIGTIRCGKEEIRAGEYLPPTIKVENFHYIKVQTPTETYSSYGILITRYVYSYGQKSKETEYDPPTMGLTLIYERGQGLIVSTSRDLLLNPSKLKVSLMLIKDKGDLLGTYSADSRFSQSISLDYSKISSIMVIPETIKFNVKSTGNSPEFGAYAEGDFSFSLIDQNDPAKTPIPATGTFKLSCRGLCS